MTLCPQARAEAFVVSRSRSPSRFRAQASIPLFWLAEHRQDLQTGAGTEGGGGAEVIAQLSDPATKRGVLRMNSHSTAPAWIGSKRFDLLFFFGSGAVAFAVGICVLLVPVTLVPLVWLWLWLIDGRICSQPGSAHTSMRASGKRTHGCCRFPCLRCRPRSHFGRCRR